MYCPKCGASNPDDATYCKTCGSQLQITNSGGAYPNPSPNYPGSRAASKSPIIAAILNLFFGIGYWYLGYRRVLNVPTWLFVLITLIVYAILSIFFFGILSLLIAIVLAIDGYQKGEGQRGFIQAEF